MKNIPPIYVTGNINKAEKLKNVLGLNIDHHSLDLDEIQSKDMRVVVEHKVRQAYEILKQPVLVEDTCLSFVAIDGLPGPFIKFFVETENGLENLCSMLDGFSSRDATADCLFGYFDGENLEIIHGSSSGQIADHPRGNNGFGWDKIYQQDGFGGKTRGELNDDEYSRAYMATKPFTKLREFLLK